MPTLTCTGEIKKVAKTPGGATTLTIDLDANSVDLAVLNSMNFGPDAGQVTIEISQLQEKLPGTQGENDEPFPDLKMKTVVKRSPVH